MFAVIVIIIINVAAFTVAIVETALLRWCRLRFRIAAALLGDDVCLKIASTDVQHQTA